MKKAKVLILLFITSFAFAQKTAVVSGSFESLKGISEFNLVFDFSNFKVDWYVTEESFLDTKVEEYTDQGNSKFAKIFKDTWNLDKEGRYIPKFIESFNKRFNGEVKVGKNLSSAKYTATIKTTYIHPGSMSNDGTSSRINALITITENANSGNILLVYSFIMEKKVPVKQIMGGFDPVSGDRISETYAKLAKDFAEDLKKSQR